MLLNAFTVCLRDVQVALDALQMLNSIVVPAESLFAVNQESLSLGELRIGIFYEADAKLSLIM